MRSPLSGQRRSVIRRPASPVLALLPLLARGIGHLPNGVNLPQQLLGNLVVIQRYCVLVWRRTQRPRLLLLGRLVLVLAVVLVLVLVLATTASTDRGRQDAVLGPAFEPFLRVWGDPPTWCRRRLLAFALALIAPSLLLPPPLAFLVAVRLRLRREALDGRGQVPGSGGGDGGGRGWCEG